MLRQAEWIISQNSTQMPPSRMRGFPAGPEVWSYHKYQRPESQSLSQQEGQYVPTVLKVDFLLSHCVHISAKILNFGLFSSHLQISQQFYSHHTVTECVSGLGLHSAFIIPLAWSYFTDCVHSLMHFSVHALAVCCDMNSNQLTSLGISLWPTAQEATVGPSKSFLDLSQRPIKNHKHVSLHTKTCVNSYHTHILQPDFWILQLLQQLLEKPHRSAPGMVYKYCQLLNIYYITFMLKLFIYKKEHAVVTKGDWYQQFWAFRMSKNDLLSVWDR